MKAIAYTKCAAADSTDALEEIELVIPTPQGSDLLVEVRAVSVNPCDAKAIRFHEPDGKPRILGYDAAGIVSAIGRGVTRFAIGDEVYYAGDITRPGSNSEYQLVDERIVGHRPRRLSFAETAALPLTTITAWEMLFDRLMLPRHAEERGNLLIIGGSGGVGSIAIQLARQLTNFRIVATAGSLEGREWCRSLGAHDTLDHHIALRNQIEVLGLGPIEYIFSISGSDNHWRSIVALVAPQGRVGLIDDPDKIDVRDLKSKCASFHWEAMFTRPRFATKDMVAQHNLLESVAKLIDEGRIRSTISHHYGRITAKNLWSAYLAILGGHTRGKIVLEGF